MVFAAASAETTSAFTVWGLGLAGVVAVGAAAADLVGGFGEAFVCALATPAVATATTRARTIFLTVPPGEQMTVREETVQCVCPADTGRCDRANPLCVLELTPMLKPGRGPRSRHERHNEAEGPPGRDRRQALSTSLPTWSLDSMTRCASAASASGNVR